MKPGALPLICCLAIAPARAMAEDPVAARTSVDVRPKGDWYGWQIMLADLGAISTVYVGGALAVDSSSFVFIPITGGLAFYAGGPLVHVAHGNGQSATKSFLLRLLVPIGGAALGVAAGALIDARHHSDCSEGCARVDLGVGGFGAGMLGAMATDWITAREPMPALRIAPEATAPSWAPTLAVTHQGAGVGMMFRF